VIEILAWPLFAIGAYSDHRRRRAPNSLWVAGLAIAALSAGYTGEWLLPIGGMAAMIALSGVAYHVELIGGADAKAVITAGALYPAQLPAVAIATGLAGAGVAAGSETDHIPFLIPLFVGVSAAVVMVAL
jgi:Flp pilus assembly protein protease CpaA